MNNRRGPQWQGSVGQHFAEWEQRPNRSVYDRLNRGPEAYNSSTQYVTPHDSLSTSDGFVQHRNGGSVFDRLVGAPKRKKPKKRPERFNKQAEEISKVGKTRQWVLWNKGGRTGCEVEVTDSALDAVTAISKAPADTADWNAVIDEALDGVKITQEEIDQKELVLAMIEETLKTNFPRAICRLFGSSETKLGFKDCDADIYASLGYDPYEHGSFDKNRKRASNLASQLGKHFRNHPELSVVSVVSHIHAPVVKLYHKASKTRVDLSFRPDFRAFNIHNSSLVKLLCDSHPQVHRFIQFLMLWGSVHHDPGPAKLNNLFGNYPLTLLALFMCQTREQKLVPSVEDLREQLYDSNIIDEWEFGYGTDVAAFWQTQEKGPPTSVEGGVLALALEFFEYYANLDFYQLAVCPLVGKLINRNALRSSDAAEPTVETGDAGGCDLGEMDHDAPVDTQDDDSAKVTESGSNDAIADTVGTDGALPTDAVAVDSANEVNTVVTDVGVPNETVAEDATTITDVDSESKEDTTGMEVAPVDTVGTDVTVTTETVTEDATTITDADAESRKNTTGMEVTPLETVVTDVTVTTETVPEDDSTITDADAESRKDTSGMDVDVTVAEDAVVTTGNITDDTNHAITSDGDNDTTTAINRISIATIDSLPKALLGPERRKIKYMFKRRGAMCIIDVFALDNNVTSHYHLQHVNVFKKNCRISAKIIKEVQKQEKPLSALLSKFEDSE